ncbi:hypothetical protein [Hahella ganghwensis]|uniref:hypothetical protein n=1 Tax=Hahella ganghwensis TaxID=286420 RepID=UPI000367B2DC|nr:hypothetical protein [Hahella ganghwensis]
MNIHEPIKNLITCYAGKLGDGQMLRIMEKLSLDSEPEAQHVLEFCEKMFDLALEMEERKEVILGEPAQAYDAEKAYSVLNDFVSDQGFDYLIED